MLFPSGVATTASLDLQKLDKIHSSFVQHIQKISKETTNGGSIKADENAISATVLSLPIKVIRRPVAAKERLTANEYSFIATHKDDDLSILRLYLSPFGKIFTDPALSIPFCDFNDEQLALRLIESLVSGLIASPVFAPENVTQHVEKK